MKIWNAFAQDKYNGSMHIIHFYGWDFCVLVFDLWRQPFDKCLLQCHKIKSFNFLNYKVNSEGRQLYIKLLIQVMRYSFPLPDCHLD